MARCGCQGSSCSCVVQGGDGVVVSGAGSAANPYRIDVESPDISGVLQVQDTDTVNLTLSGAGTAAEPYVISAEALLSLGELVDVDDSDTTAGYVLGRLADGSFGLVPASTAPVGVINSDDSIDGDGSSGDPLRVHEYDRIAWLDDADNAPNIGNLGVGDVGDPGSYRLFVARQGLPTHPNGTAETDLALFSSGPAFGHLAQWRLLHDGAVANALTLRPNGAVYAGPSGNEYPIAYRQAVGNATLSFGNQVQSSVAVTFPAGMFTASPTITANVTAAVGPAGSPAGRRLADLRVHNRSSNGFTATAYVMAGQDAVTGSVGITWNAVQMTP